MVPHIASSPAGDPPAEDAPDRAERERSLTFEGAYVVRREFNSYVLSSDGQTSEDGEPPPEADERPHRDEPAEAILERLADPIVAGMKVLYSPFLDELEARGLELPASYAGRPRFRIDPANRARRPAPPAPAPASPAVAPAPAGPRIAPTTRAEDEPYAPGGTGASRRADIETMIRELAGCGEVAHVEAAAGSMAHFVGDRRALEAGRYQLISMNRHRKAMRRLILGELPPEVVAKGVGCACGTGSAAAYFGPIDGFGGGEKGRPAASPKSTGRPRNNLASVVGSIA